MLWLEIYLELSLTEGVLHVALDAIAVFELTHQVVFDKAHIGMIEILDAVEGSIGLFNEGSQILVATDILEHTDLDSRLGLLRHVARNSLVSLDTVLLAEWQHRAQYDESLKEESAADSIVRNHFAQDGCFLLDIFHGFLSEQ